ncbi:MAG: DUF547 domain-containing protein [Deltaproteobacteria bacterium]|nr:DUF547 domain-containing protein [Deltaproteobacteria bacterium]
MKAVALTLCVVACTAAGCRDAARSRPALPCAPLDHGMTALSTVLARYVSNGVVDYAGLKSEGEASLGAALRAFERVCKADYDRFTAREKLAFWVNAYNAYTLRLILDDYPVKSIRDIGFLPSAAFRKSFIPLFNLRGEALSLNDIEHEILRKEFREPRLHFVLVCASKGCPALRSAPYRASNIDEELDVATRAFVRDASKNRYNASTRTLQLSSIFKWYRDDFEHSVGTLESFFARYATDDVAQALKESKVKVTFLAYDWALNGR